MSLVFADLCNKKFPTNFGITEDFQEFIFIESDDDSMFSNIDEDYQLVSQEKSEDSEKNGRHESEQVMNEDDVSINMEELVVSSPPLNSRDNAQKVKDILTQTMTQTCKVLEEIERSHQEEIFRLNSELENLRNHCQTLEQTMSQTCKVREETERSHQEEIFRLNSELENLRKQNLELKAQSSAKIANLESELEILKNEKQELMLQCNSLKDENIKLSEDLHSVKSAVEKVFVPYSK